MKLKNKEKDIFSKMSCFNATLNIICENFLKNTHFIVGNLPPLFNANHLDGHCLPEQQQQQQQQPKDQQPADLAVTAMTATTTSSEAAAAVDLCTLHQQFSELLSLLRSEAPACPAIVLSTDAASAAVLSPLGSTLQLIKAVTLTVVANGSSDRSSSPSSSVSAADAFATSELRKRFSALLTVVLGCCHCCCCCSLEKLQPSMRRTALAFIHQTICSSLKFVSSSATDEEEETEETAAATTAALRLNEMSTLLCSVLSLEKVLSQGSEGDGDSSGNSPQSNDSDRDSEDGENGSLDNDAVDTCELFNIDSAEHHVYEEIHHQLTDLLQQVKMTESSPPTQSPPVTSGSTTTNATTTTAAIAMHSTRQQVVLATEWLLSHCHLFSDEKKAPEEEESEGEEVILKSSKFGRDNAPCFSTLKPFSASSSSLVASPPVKLSTSGLMVRSDCVTPYTLQSEFVITSGVYFYEVTLVTGGSMAVGWASRDSSVLEERGRLLGADDDRSIGFNGHQRSISHSETVTLGEIAAWRVGDTVGCLLDTDRHKAVFYLNGLPIYCKVNHFNGRHIVAAATLTHCQQIYFNFGQHEWKFPPPGVLFADFHSEARGNASIYRIQEPTVVTIRREFVQFKDEIQSELDLVITKWLTRRTSCLVLPELLRNPEFIKYEQGILRLSQSMINLTQNVDNSLAGTHVQEDLYYYYDKLFFVYFIESNVSKINILSKFLRMIGPIIAGPSSLATFHWTIHRNLCLILLILLEHCKYAMKQEISDAILDYLLTIIERCSRPETVLYALIGVELRVVNIIQFDLTAALRRRIVDMLTVLASTNPDLSDLSLIESGKKSTADRFYRYQIAFCARWTLEHIFIPSNLLTSSTFFPLKLPPVKLSTDRLGVRAETMQQYLHVRSSYAFLRGAFFYEVTLLTGGLLRIGWSSRASKLEEYKKLGDDRQSVGFNGYDRWIWHGKPVALRNLPRWRPGDIVGCLLDTDRQLITFYLNGHPIQVEAIDFSSNQFSPPYFAAAYLFPHQQCTFNFGQAPFRYPPNESRNYQSFHECTGGDVTRYRLSALSTKGELWHRYQFEDSQLVFDEWVLELVDRVVSEPLHDEEYFNVTLLEKFASLMDLDCGRLRLYHSIIRLEALKGDDQRLDVLVGWIEHYSTPKIGQCTDDELVSLVNSFIEVPLMGDAFNDAKRRNIVIVLFLMARSSLVYLQQQSVHPEDFFVETYHFISQTLLQLYSVDKWTLLFAINCLQIFARFEVNRNHLLAEERLLNKLLEMSQFYEQTSVAELYGNFDFLSYQIGFCAHLCLENIATKTVENKPSSIETRFNILSSCRFTARGDWERANFCSSYTFFSGSYYYEAVLLTSGSMKIGWATTEFNQEKFFVCLDLYRRYLWHNGKQIEMKHLPCWKVGDVLGCFVNTKKSKFVFYLNGNKLPLKTKFPKTAQFYSKPYFAAVYLASHQQVAFNFGQTPFKWAPKGIQFGTFCTAVKMVWTC